MSYFDQENQALLRRGVVALEEIAKILSDIMIPPRVSEPMICEDSCSNISLRSDRDMRADLLYTIEKFEQSVKIRSELGLPEDYATKVFLEDLYRQRDAYDEEESLRMKRDMDREISNPRDYTIVEVPKDVGTPYIIVGSPGIHMTKEYADVNTRLDSLNDLAKEMHDEQSRG